MAKQMTAEICHKLFYYRDGFLYWKKNQRRWKHAYADELVGRIDNGGSRVLFFYYKEYKIRYLIWLMHGGDPSADVININKDKADNRIENLGDRNSALNPDPKLFPYKNMDIDPRNRLSKRNTSGYRGVTYLKKTKTWRGSLTHRGRKYYTGTFKDKEECAEAVKYLRYKLQTGTYKQEEHSNQLG